MKKRDFQRSYNQFALISDAKSLPDVHYLSHSTHNGVFSPDVPESKAT